MRRTLTALACLVIPLAAACGSSSTHATTGPTSRKPPPSLAKAESESSTSSSNAPHFLGNSASSWCDLARQVEDSAKIGQDFGRDPRSRLNAANSLLSRAESEAPSAISNDMRTFADGLKVLTKALADANYDYTKISPAQIGALENPNLAAASQHIVAYDQQVCGTKN